MTEELARRIAVMVALVERAPGQQLGRTALMKLVYFLSVLRNVNLGYHFSLYSYGPFDSEVLQDLDYAKSLQAITSRVVGYGSGYGYEIQPGPDAPAVKALASKFVHRHAADIEWVMRAFGKMGAADLELASTIVYADRESDDNSIMSLAQRVRDVKPHFSLPKIRETIRKLSESGLIESAQ